MTFLLPVQSFCKRRRALISTEDHLQFFRRNHKREQSENKYFANKTMCTQDTQKRALRKHNNIIIYSSKIGQYIMWITRL